MLASLHTLLYIPDIKEVQFYSEAAGNPGHLERKSDAWEDSAGESPISVTFKTEGIVPEFKKGSDISNYVLHMSHLVGKINGNTIQDGTPSPEFDNLPDYNPQRGAVILSASQKERVKKILGEKPEGTKGEIIYTSLGEEVFLENAQGKMEPIGLSDNF